MRHRENAGLITLKEIQAFMTANDALLGNINRSKARAGLDDLVTKMESEGTSQGAAQTASRGGTKLKAGLREALRHQMQSIAAIASSELAGTPEISTLRLPDDATSDAVLVAAARSMAASADLHKQVFVDHSLGSDCTDQLRSAVAALEQGLIARDAHRRARKRATANVSQYASAARDAVRELHGLIVPALAGAPDGKMLEWLAVRRIPTKPGVPQGTVHVIPTPAPAPTPPVTPSA
jgi:hypothetical protein